MEGLYPINNSDSSSEENMINLITGDTEKENMYANSAFCPILGKIDSEVKNSAEMQEFEKTVNAPLLKELADIFGWSPQKRIVEIFDCFQAHACHGMEFPEEMTSEFYSQIRDNLLYVTKANNNAQRQNFTYAQIAIASFLQDVLDLLHSVHSNTSSVKFALYSGHDSTIFPFLKAYDVWDGQWPSYASLLQIEMLSDFQNGRNFVRLVYKNQPLRLPACDLVELCPYEKFREITLRIVGAAALCSQT